MDWQTNRLQFDKGLIAHINAIKNYLETTLALNNPYLKQLKKLRFAYYSSRNQEILNVLKLSEQKNKTGGISPPFY